MRGLNESGGRNRIRFQKLKSRVKHERKRVDVVHKTKNLDFIFDDDKPPPTDISIVTKTGCLFYDHVQAYLELNTSRAYQRLGKDLAPLCRSLPEVLYHLDAIVARLTLHLKSETWGPAHENALLLVAVLGKEVGVELVTRKHFRPLMDALVHTLDPANPEATARAVQSMAHLFTYLSKPLLADLDVMKRYYGPLLGHKKDFIRRYAAEALAGLLRRLGDKALAKHVKAIMKAAASALAAQQQDTHTHPQTHTHKPGSGGGGSKRGQDLLDGISLLIFHLIRGIQSQGQLHSKGPHLLKSLFLQEAKGQTDTLSITPSPPPLSYVQRSVIQGMLSYLCPHMKPPHAAPLWKEALAAVSIAPREEAGEANGLERSVHVCVLLLQYRKGWLLSNDDVRKAQMGGLREVLQELTQLETFSLLREATKAEIIHLLAALWEWQAMRRRRRHGGVCVDGEEQALEEELMEATGVVLGPESGAEPELVGELATRVLLLGGMVKEGEEEDDEEEEEGEEGGGGGGCGSSSLLINACLRRAVSPACPLLSWLELLRALLREDGTTHTHTHTHTMLGGGDPVLLEGFARDLMLRIARATGGEKSLMERLTALRCLVPLVRICAHTRTHTHTHTTAAEVGKEALRVVEEVAMAREGEDEALVNQAIITLTGLWALDPTTDSSSSSSSSKKHKQQRTKRQEHKAQLVTHVWHQLQATPSNLLAVRALTALLEQEEEEDGTTTHTHTHTPTTSSSPPSLPSLEDLLLVVSSNLHAPSHLLRLSTLRLLTHFPPLPFRDHPVGEAAKRQENKNNNNDTPFVGPCPALATCLELEETPISISAERGLGMLLERIEIMAASGRLPGAYIAPLSSYCLGLLHVRYSELWPLASKTFAALSLASSCVEETQGVWGYVLETVAEVDGRLSALTYTQTHTHTHNEGGDEGEGAEEEKERMNTLITHLAASQWGVTSTPTTNETLLISFLLQEPESSFGTAEGQASKLSATDPLSSLTWVFDALKRCAPLLGRKSAELSTLFVAFLQHQYFALYNDDPEALELKGDLAQALEEEAIPASFRVCVVVVEEGEKKKSKKTKKKDKDKGAETSTSSSSPSSLSSILPTLLHPTRLTAKAARGKLLAFLKLFAVGGVPKQGSIRTLLERIFAGFLSRPDGPIAAAALDCLVNGKLPYLTPYAQTCKALLEDVTLRDELVRFNLATDVQPEHREGFIPLLIRLLFGRFLAKASKARTRTSKDAPAARRAAIVSFLAGAQNETEFREFVQLMLRPFLVDPKVSFEGEGNLEVGGASPGRRLGFLHLLSSVIRQMGFHVLPFVGAFWCVCLGLLREGYEALGGEEEEEEVEVGEGGEEEEAEAHADEGEEEDDEEDDTATATTNRRRGRSQATLRLVSTRTLTELLTQYAGAFNFAAAAPQLWSILGGSVARLPAMCSGARQAPALLDLILALTQHEGLLPVYVAYESTLTPTLLTCLSAGQGPPMAVASPILSIMERLCEADGAVYLLPHLPVMVEQVAKRLQLVQASTTSNKDPLLERCLTLLCQTSQLAATATTTTDTSVSVDDSTLSSLFGLLFPRLKSPRLLTIPVKGLVLQAYAALVTHMSHPRRDVVLLSKLLGPAGLGTTGFGPSGALREPLVAAFVAMAGRRDDMQDLRGVVEVLVALNAPDEELLEGRNLGVVMPAWTALAEEGKWVELMAAAGGSGLALVPLVAHALSCLHDEEVVVRVAAGASLRAMVTAAAKGKEGEWLWLLQAGLLPSLRAGMGQPRDAVRQGYVMVMAELVRAVQVQQQQQAVVVVEAEATPAGGEGGKKKKDKEKKKGSAAIAVVADSPSSLPLPPPPPSSWMVAHAELFHGDLGCLLRDEDTEADFFHNIIHIQVHRRTRALQRLGKVLATQHDQQHTHTTITSSSLVHVLLPLAAQPLLYLDKTISQPKAPDPGLMHEASVATAKVAQQLSWSHYYGLIRRFLREISLVEVVVGGGNGGAVRDKALVTGLCSVLDVFHFPMLPPGSIEEKVVEEEAMDVVVPAAEEEEEEEGEGEEGEEVSSPTPAPAPQQAKKKDDLIWRTVTTHLLPSLRGLLLKESKDKDGGKLMVLRAPMALALLKLIKMLPPTSFTQELTRLLMTVCGTLRSRDSNTRDAAREVLARMAQDLGPSYLHLIIQELKAALREGYMLHIRIFTLHTVLRALEEVYQPPIDAPSYPVPSAGVLVGGEPVQPPLDACLSEAVALLTEDIFGEAAGAKEAEAEVKSATIKEAKGQKALDGLEILARLLLFRPTYAVACPEEPASLSSVHALVKPFLFQLHDSESPKIHGRVNEALQRVVAGLAVNSTVKPEEILLYVYGLVSPFVLRSEEDDEAEEEEEGAMGGGNDEGEDSSDDDEEEDALQVIGKAGRRPSKHHNQKHKQKSSSSSSSSSTPKKEAASWLPVDGTLKLAIEAKAAQRASMREDARVLDGRNAPKLTGWGRHGTKQRRAEGGMFGSPAALAAGVLGLRLLHSYLKRLGSPSQALVPMLDPYVALLARCVRRKVNDSIVLLSLKCLALMLRYPTSLPSLPHMAPRLVRSSLSLLSMAGGPANSRDEIVQSCLRILTLLIASSEDDDDVDTAANTNTNNNNNIGNGAIVAPSLEKRTTLPIPAKSLGALVSLLRAAALDYDHVNAPFALVRALVARRAMVPEMYDLMEQMLGIAVTSRRPTVRQMGSQIVVSFLLHYPLTSAKVAGFLQQAVRNLGYEYEDGRAAALSLLQSLVVKLPGPVLDEHAQMLFLPMVLRLVNDPAPKTRAVAAEAMGALLRRVSGDVYHTLLEYQCRWMSERDTNEGLARAAAQAVGLFVEARPDLFKRGEGGNELCVLLAVALGGVEKRGAEVSVGGIDGGMDLEAPRERQGEAALGWEMAYHCLGSLSKVYEKLPSMMEGFLEGEEEGVVLLSAASELLCYRHAWVRLAASRLVGHYLDRRVHVGGKKQGGGGSGGGGGSLATELVTSTFLSNPLHAANLARRLCVQIDRPSLSPELSLRAVKSLVFLTSALAQGKGGGRLQAQHEEEGDREEEEEEEEEGDNEGGEDDEEEEEESVPKDLLSWIFHRASFMARRKGEDRRCAVFRFFAAVATLESQALVERFLPHMLSPLYRATTDGQAEASVHGNDAVELAKEVMNLLEEKAGAGAFLQALAEVQKQAAAKRAGRKKQRAVEAITDPEAASKRRVEKNLMKRDAAKRKKLKRRGERGERGGVDRGSKRQKGYEGGKDQGNKDQGM